MTDYWVSFFSGNGEHWTLSAHMGMTEGDAIRYWTEQPGVRGFSRVKVFRCQADHSADILTVAQQLVWERNGDVQRFINQKTLNAS